MKGSWLVRAWVAWGGLPRVGGYYIQTKISHHFKSNIAACGLRFSGLKIREREYEKLAGTKPARCKNCERALAARKKHTSPRG